MNQVAGQEAWWLLRHFSRTVDQLWSTVGSDASRGLLVLARVLVEHHLVRWRSYFDADDPELGVLDELRVLFSVYLIELRPDHFEPPDFPVTEEDIVGSSFMIWRVVRRLCAVALSRPSVRVFEGAEFDVEYFFDRYTE